MLVHDMTQAYKNRIGICEMAIRGRLIPHAKTRRYEMRSFSLFLGRLSVGRQAGACIEAGSLEETYYGH